MSIDAAQALGVESTVGIAMEALLMVRPPGCYSLILLTSGL